MALHPLVVILALLAGGQLLGVAGAVLAVPVAAAVAVVVDGVHRKVDDGVDRGAADPDCSLPPATPAPAP